MDPELGKDMHERIQEQKTYAQHRLDETNRELLDLLQDKQEVYDGIVKWEHFNPEKTPNITINDSYAQDIQGIKPESQDVVFLNFVLDKVYDGDFSLRAERDKLEAEIGKALENALLIAKVGGKIMGVHNISSHSDEIIIALDMLEYRVDYQQK